MPTFDIKDHKAIGKYIGDQLDKSIRRGLLSTAQRLVSIIKTEIIPAQERVPFDIGTYLAGWKGEPTAGGAEVYNDVPHAGIVEHGVEGSRVRVGRAMIEALTEWVIRKGIGTDEDPSKVAWAIAKSMEFLGIFNGGKGLKILEQAMTRVPEVVKEEVIREIESMGGT